MPDRKLVFISHITEEKEVALAFKALLDTSFLGMIEFFVSSDDESIRMGQHWLNDITAALKACVVEVVIASPTSVKRPWINFEAGAGWVREIPVVPLCHSGMVPANLPMPLSLLQAARATEMASLKLILPVLASAIGSRVPAVDFTGFVGTVVEFQESYTFWDQCNEAFGLIREVDARAFISLSHNQVVDIVPDAIALDRLRRYMPLLTDKNILRMESTGTFIISAGGSSGTAYRLIPMAACSATMQDSRFSPRDG